jgi:RNA polymerase sigma-70 factor (ECF subfamily)
LAGARLYHLYVDDIRPSAAAALRASPATNDADVIETLRRRDCGIDRSSRGATAHAASDLTLALPSCTVEQRALIAWHDMEGYSLDDLASALGVPVGTLKSRLHRTRAQLRQILMEPCTVAAACLGERTFA